MQVSEPFQESDATLSGDLARFQIPSPRALRKAHELLTPPTIRLRDGTVGYFMPGRLDACFQCGVATCLQIPVEEVPDIRHAARIARGQSVESISRLGWRVFARWCATHDLEMVFHRRVPPCPEGRWIGIRSASGDLGLTRDDFSHVLNLVGTEVLHNPSAPPALLKGGSFYDAKLADIQWGISFAPLRRDNA